ncbi:hypothetical protein ACFUIY_12660 [Streptomyces griseorubiginosus]|uniref:hypothetical protein n=1 Tax=Streptomyces griseorubiginosus TaxID=67304 RepID=UPI0036304915
MLLFVGWPLVGIVAGILILDIGGQGLHVLNQRIIHDIDAAACNRLNSIYMTFHFPGGALGSAVASFVWTGAGWTGVCLTGLGVTAFALVLWVLTAPWQRGGGGRLTAAGRARGGTGRGRALLLRVWQPVALHVDQQHAQSDDGCAVQPFRRAWKANARPRAAPVVTPDRRPPRHGSVAVEAAHPRR